MIQRLHIWPDENVQLSGFRLRRVRAQPLCKRSTSSGCLSSHTAYKALAGVDKTLVFKGP